MLASSDKKIYITANVSSEPMISNERPSPYNRNANQWPDAQAKPPVAEDTIKMGQLQIERKAFYFTLKANVRGRFLRISEEVGGRRNSIMIPSTGLVEFQNMLAEMVKADGDLPVQ